MIYRTINESVAKQNFSDVITEATGVTNPEKLAWMSTMLAINERVIMEEQGMNINENNIAGYGVQAPSAVPGMGAVAWPGVGQANGDTMAPGYNRGSGDMPSRQLAFAMNVAAYTVGLDTLPVLPMEYPSIMFGYMDYVYAGNLSQSQGQQGETDIFIKLTGSVAGYVNGAYTQLKKGDRVVLVQVPTDAEAVLADVENALYGIYLGKDRVNGEPIIKFEGVVKATATGSTGADRGFTLGEVKDLAASVALKTNATDGAWALVKGTANSTSEVVISAADEVLVADQFISGEDLAVSGDLVSAVDMFIPEFATPGSTYDGNDEYGASRARGEEGTQNIISLRVFSTSVEAKTEEVLGEITRTQKRDLAAYGQDAIGQLFKAAQNELVQLMNADIIRTEFRLGVTSAVKLKNTQGINLNLYIGDPAVNADKALSQFGVEEFKDILGVDRLNEFASVKNAESNSSAENNFTRSRRIITKIQAASNIISQVGRHGSGDFVVTNIQVATAIQDIKGFVANPFDNTLVLNDSTLYSIGTLNGKIQVYVEPSMTWNDTRVLVGRKGTEMDPGLKMFIYTMGEVTQTLSEVSMSDKILVSNRYALVPCGFHPETQYLTFAVNSDYELV